MPFVYFVGYYGAEEDEDDILKLEYCSAIICSPKVWTSKVEVIDGGV
jgi:hypothetical protein